MRRLGICAYFRAPGFFIVLRNTKEPVHENTCARKKTGTPRGHDAGNDFVGSRGAAAYIGAGGYKAPREGGFFREYHTLTVIATICLRQRVKRGNKQSRGGSRLTPLVKCSGAGASVPEQQWGWTVLEQVAGNSSKEEFAQP